MSVSIVNNTNRKSIAINISKISCSTLINHIPRELYRANEMRIVELFSQVGDMDIDRVRAVGKIRAVVFPYVLENFLARYDPSAIFQQIRKECELFRREGNLTIVFSADALGREIDLQILDFYDLIAKSGVVCHLGPRALHDIRHAQIELLEIERLDEIVVGAGGEPLHFVDGLIERRQKEVGNVDAALFRHFDERESVNLWDHAIHDEKIVLDIAHVFIRSLAVVGGVRFPSFQAEIVGDIFGDCPIVFDDKQMHGIGGWSENSCRSIGARPGFLLCCLWKSCDDIIERVSSELFLGGIRVRAQIDDRMLHRHAVSSSQSD